MVFKIIKCYEQSSHEVPSIAIQYIVKYTLHNNYNKYHWNLHSFSVFFCFLLSGSNVRIYYQLLLQKEVNLFSTEILLL